MTQQLLIVRPDDHEAGEGPVMPRPSLVTSRLAASAAGFTAVEVAVSRVTDEQLDASDAVLVDPGEGGDPVMLAGLVGWGRETGVPMLLVGPAASAVADDLRLTLGSRLGASTPTYRAEDSETADLLRHGWVLEDRLNAPPILRLPGYPYLASTPSLQRSTGPQTALGGLLAAAAHHREQARRSRPRPYLHQMRGPRYRWWRPLLALVVFAASYLALAVAIYVGATVSGALGPSLLRTGELGVDPVSTLVLDLSIAAFIPAALLGAWVGHGRSPWRLLSVAGETRWDWLYAAFWVVAPIWVLYLALSWYLDGADTAWHLAQQWLGLLLVVVFVTPFQAAGEELVFRGLLVQSVGAWIRPRGVAFAVTTTLSTALFCLAHGSLDGWILLDIGALGVAGCYLAWRTGGLEAGIAIHVVNNVFISILGLAFGGFQGSFVDTTSSGDPLSAGLSVLVMTVATFALTGLARRRGIARRGFLTPAVG